MARYEWPALLGLVLCFAYIFPSDARLRYLAIYGCGVLLAYSLIPYKTPWCIISILWPFYFLFGAFAQRSHKTLRLRHCPLPWPRFVLVVTLAASTVLSGSAELLSLCRRARALCLRADISRNSNPYKATS